MRSSSWMLALWFCLAGCTQSALPDADNTARNARDRDPSRVTAQDQGLSAADTQLTQRIRQAIVADESLSLTAKNVKVIAQNGRVTLRGPVSNAQEKTTIVALATGIAGAGQVVDDLEAKL